MDNGITSDMRDGINDLESELDDMGKDIKNDFNNIGRDLPKNHIGDSSAADRGSSVGGGSNGTITNPSGAGTNNGMNAAGAAG